MLKAVVTLGMGSGCSNNFYSAGLSISILAAVVFFSFLSSFLLNHLYYIGPSRKWICTLAKKVENISKQCCLGQNWLGVTRMGCSMESKERHSAVPRLE